MLIGERTAEMIKINVGSALTDIDSPPDDYPVNGRDLMTGIPKQIIVSYSEIAHAIDKSISKISAERLVIFHDAEHQNWRWPMSREASGKGIIRLVNHEHVLGQKTLSLLQRLKFIQISLNAEAPTLVDMLLRWSTMVQRFKWELAVFRMLFWQLSETIKI